MRPWSLLPLLAASGCLYLDSINHPPTIALDAEVTTYKGVALEIQPTVGDPDDGASGVKHVDLAITALDGPLSDCDYTYTPYGRNFQVTFFRTGMFQIALTATDDHGSPSGTAAVETVTVLDALPVFSSSSMIAQTSSGDACGLNTAGDAIPLALADPPTDADADAHLPDCSPTEQLAYTWRISAQPSGTKPALTLYDKKSGCAPVTATSTTTLMVLDPTVQVCLWTDPMIAGSTEMYSIVFDVTDNPSDPTRTVTSPVANVAVGADQAPCITGTNPVAGSYVVDRTIEQQFDITGAKDDRDPFGSNGLTFAWSVWRDADPNWREVPSWTTPSYQLDVSSFDVGEHVRVRAEAVDRTGARVPPSSCPIDADDCQVASCASLPDVCHKWKTWDLELR